MSSFLPEASNRTLDVVENLVERCKSAGGMIQTDLLRFGKSDASSCEDTAGMGVFANVEVKKGQLLMEVPFAECLSTEKVMAYEPLKRIFEEQAGLAAYPDEVLAIGIIYAITNQDEACGWLDYLRACPGADEMNTTIYWTEEQVEELQGCTVYHLTKMMQRQIEQDWQQVHMALKEVYPDVLGDATKDLYMWALSMVYSRAVGMRRKGEYTRALIPVLDMANMLTTSDAGETFHYDEANDKMQLVCSADVAAGEEIFSVVGEYCNAKLAFTYGYVLHKQHNKAVDLWTNVSPQSEHASLKQKLLKEQSLTANQTYDFVGTLRPNFISGALLSTVRVINASGEELHALQVGHKFIANMVSTSNERRVYESLRELFVARLEPDYVEPERVRLGKLLLDGKPHNDREVMALIIRVEQREVIQSCLAFLERCSVALEELGDAYVPPDHASKTPSVM